jgi:hypothetical protein
VSSDPCSAGLPSACPRPDAGISDSGRLRLPSQGKFDPSEKLASLFEPDVEAALGYVSNRLANFSEGSNFPWLGRRNLPESEVRS